MMNSNIFFTNSLFTHPLQKTVDVELPAQFTTCRTARNPDGYIRGQAFFRFARSFFQGRVNGSCSKNIDNNKEYQQGYVAIVTVLVIGAVMLSVGMAVVLNSINGGQGSLAEIKKETSLGLTESCAEEALLRINNDGALPASIILPEGTCTVTINLHSGSDWDVTVAGTLDGYTKNIRVTATRGTMVTLNSWKEI
jgi:hypothetical protein